MKFQTWFLHNRIRIFIWAFVTIIPLTLILVSYIGAYSNNKKVHFDEKIDKDTIFVKDFEDSDDIKYLEFDILWDELYRPKLIDGSYEQGSYVFYISYTPKLNYNITSVKVTPLLSTDWVNTLSLGKELTVTNVSRRMQVPYNHVLPKKPLLFVKVNEPSLYLKVDLEVNFGQTNTNITIYVKHSLKDLNPNTIH